MQEQPKPRSSLPEEVEETAELVRSLPEFLRTASSVARAERDRRKSAARDVAQTPLDIYYSPSDLGAEVFRDVNHHGNK